MRRLGLVVVLVPLACSPADAPAGGHPEVRGTALEQNAACESCHADVAREWRGSLHAQSRSVAEFQRAFAREPLPFCTGCHAPEVDADAGASEAALAAIGVGCVTCHEARAGEMATRACDGCHEFAFPDGTGKMQLTVTEHRASPRASTSCAACHMRRVDGHASHAFASSRDGAELRRAAWIDAARDAEDVVVTLRAREIGHAFPTGDLFRRLRVEVSAVGDAGSARSAYLQRNAARGGPDTRPFVGGQSAAEVRLAAPTTIAPVAWRVVYERVDYPTSPDGTDAVLSGSVEIAAGVLGP